MQSMVSKRLKYQNVNSLGVSLLLMDTFLLKLTNKDETASLCSDCIYDTHAIDL